MSLTHIIEAVFDKLADDLGLTESGYKQEWPEQIETMLLSFTNSGSHYANQLCFTYCLEFLENYHLTDTMLTFLNPIDHRDGTGEWLEIMDAHDLCVEMSMTDLHSVYCAWLDID